VQEDDRRPLALVHVCESQTVDVAVVGREGEVGKSLQLLLRSAHHVGHLAAEHTVGPIG
jgi:hypothetical protein